MKKLKGIIAIGLLLCTSNLTTGHDLSQRGAYTMPYLRYDSKEAVLNGNPQVEYSPDFDQNRTASEAFNQEYVILDNPKESMKWTITKPADGLTVRFTLPDDPKGNGTTAVMGIYANGKLIDKMSLTSYWAYQYMLQDYDPPTAYPEPGRFPLMRFDESHMILSKLLNEGDVLELKWISGEPIGVDFVELEKVDAPLQMPHDALSVTDFGATANDEIDDLPAFYACIKAAKEQGKSVYVPEGTFYLNDKLVLDIEGTKIQGAGMWYTNLYFCNNNRASGGVIGKVSNLHVSHMHVGTVNSARREGTSYREYKGFSGGFHENSVLEYLWVEHFEVGMWIGGYSDPTTNNLRVSHVRLRNSYADGVNFAHGTSNSVFEYSDVRNCGDDGIASWSSNNDKCNVNNTFRWCTVELGWRAGGIGMFGGGGHVIHNMYVGQHYGCAGIRFTSDFPGCSYDASKPMKVYNCTVYKCGTRKDIFQDRLASLEFHGARYDVINMELSDIDVLDSQMDGIRLMGPNVHGIVFKNININGCGMDGLISQEDGAPYRGSGVYANSGDPDQKGSATFINVKFKDCPTADVTNVNDSYNLTFKK